MEPAVRYLLVIHYAPLSILRSVAKLRQQAAFANLGILILTPNPKFYQEKWQASDVPVKFVACSFSSQAEITGALGPDRDVICSVLCRGDRYVQYLRRVIPLLPVGILAATPESLAAATNKRLMRRDFLRYFPEISPQFLQVQDASPASLAAIEQRLAYPIIIKPADLSSSVLIHSCHTKSELRSNLPHIFKTIRDIYRAEGREDEPQVIVEEYLEGDFYSIDAYVMRPDEIFFCPPVAYITAKQLGIDDFFLYKRFVPAGLDDAEVGQANQVTAKAIKALGLCHTSVHAELIRTKQGWKIIELGPRLGRFRQTMYMQGYGIDHSRNDILIHFGKKPAIPQTFKRYCAAYSIYPVAEGVLREVTQLETLRLHPAVTFLQVNKKPGELCLYAKHGGHAIVEFAIASDDKRQYEVAAQFIETEVTAVIDPGQQR